MNDDQTYHEQNKGLKKSSEVPMERRIKRAALDDKNVPLSTVARHETIYALMKRGIKRAAPADEKNVLLNKVARRKIIHEQRASELTRRIENGGCVYAVGQGDYGQLGLGKTVTEKLQFAMLSQCQDAVSVVAGLMHSVYLTQDGSVFTSGCNDEGALGRDTFAIGSEMTPGLVKLEGKAVQITGGESHTATLLEDGRVFAWGTFRDSYGSMGLTSNGKERLPVQMLPLEKVVKIASGDDHLVFLTNTGLVYSCGNAEQGQLGRICLRSTDRNCRQGSKLMLTPTKVQFGIPRTRKITDIWAGSYCTFAKVRDTGEIYACGLNNHHQLGLERTQVFAFPVKSKTFDGRDWKLISGGPYHTLALDSDGIVYVLGSNEYRQLGLGKNTEVACQLTAIPTFKSHKCIDVSAGITQSFAITSNGELYAWGMGSDGKLGTGNEDDVVIPVLIATNISKNLLAARVVGGAQHTLVLTTRLEQQQELIEETKHQNTVTIRRPRVSPIVSST